MNFIWPAGLFFAALVPLILILYFLKLHRTPKIVSSTYLWKQALDAYRVNRPFQRFRNHILLWLQLLVLALAIIALARPVVLTEMQQTDVHIYLLDHSASMGTQEQGESRLEKAKAFLRDAIRGKRDSDRMAIVAFSDRAFVASPLTTHREDLLRALDRVGPTDRPTRIEEAWGTALSIARQFDSSDIYLVSDGGFGPLDQLTQANAAVHYVPIGASTDNLGLVQLECRQSEQARDELEIFARVLNRRPAQTTTRVELYLNDALADARNLTLQPGEQGGVVFRRSRSDAGVAELRLAESDAFPADNRAWIPLGPPDPARVLIVGEQNLFLRQGLANAPQVELATLAPPAYEQLGGEVPANDLVVFDGVAPRFLSRGTYLFLGCLPPLEGFTAEDRKESPVLVNWDREHPLTRYLNFSTLHVSELLAGRDPSWMRMLLWSHRGPVISIGERGGLRLVLVRFALLDSDWPLRVTFPLFLSNLVRWAGPESEAAREGFVRVGQPLVVAVPSEATAGTLLRPDGREESLGVPESHRVVIANTELPGPYRLRWENHDREAIYAVNLLDPSESDISVPAAVTMGDASLAGLDERTLVNRELTSTFLLVALLVLLVEWALYQLLRG